MSGHLAISYQIRWANLGTGAWDAMPGALRIAPRLESGGGTNGLGWGEAVTQSAEISATFATIADSWYLRKVNAQLSINGGAYADYFTGVLLERASDDGVGLTYKAVGFDELIRRANVQTPVRRRRPIATKTTATSIEDPTAGGYVAGLINELLWRSGGRPFDQAGSYPSALYYYVCQGSAVAPAYGWSDGDNAWDELLSLTRAAGGQLYQTADGVVRYVSPLRLSEAIGSPPTFTASVYAALTMQETAEGFFNVASSAYVRRQVQVAQRIIDDAAAHQVDASGTLDVPIAFDWPVLATGAVTVEAASLQGAPVAATGALTTTTAQRATLRITNPIAAPILVSRVQIDGQPVTKDAEGQATFSGTAFRADGQDVAQRLDDNVNIQTQPDAERRCRMAVRWYGAPRPTYVARGCPFTAGLVVGQYAELTSSRYGLTAAAARVVAIDTDPITFAQDVTLVTTNGIPTISQFFVIGTSYADADTRKVGF